MKTKENKEEKKSVFDKFTNQHSLSKTLRFEIVPNSRTRELMDDRLRYDSELQTFLVDQQTEGAYQTLKSELDEIHKLFINKSLETADIDFSVYYKSYKKEVWERRVKVNEKT